ncbi:MAG: ATP-binding protein [Cryomorphaceae bacterium]|nr:MAG: ATP-binding protein [Cryomorphaceae bacterium]
MLIEFSVGNFWSFREVETLQMQAAKISSENKELDERNVITVSDDLKLLKTKAIFGANASGKSNVFRAILAMLHIIDKSLSDEEILAKNIIPFGLDYESAQEPTFFQIVFVLNETIYRYGFEASRTEIFSEWLFAKQLNPNESTIEKYLFKRSGLDIKINPLTLSEAKDFKKFENVPLYRSNSLFLAVLAAWNRPIVKAIHQYFRQDYFANPGLSDSVSWNIAVQESRNSNVRKRILKLLQSADPTIENIDLYELDETNESFLKVDDSSSSHRKEQKENPAVLLFRKGRKEDEFFPLELHAQEAEGTKKLFGLSPFIFKSLERGGVFFIDEFDARLHPKLTRKIIDLYHNPETNPHNAQLIFISHDTNLLDRNLLRRDQICFANKKKNGVTELYSLVEIKGVRNDASYEKDYLRGKYRAVPNNLNVLEDSLKDLYNAEED